MINLALTINPVLKGLTIILSDFNLFLDVNPLKAYVCFPSPSSQSSSPLLFTLWEWPVTTSCIQDYANLKVDVDLDMRLCRVHMNIMPFLNIIFLQIEQSLCDP